MGLATLLAAGNGGSSPAVVVFVGGVLLLLLLGGGRERESHSSLIDKATAPGERPSGIKKLLSRASTTASHSLSRRSLQWGGTLARTQL